jgi:hypothetical protein
MVGSEQFQGFVKLAVATGQRSVLGQRGWGVRAQAK